VPYATLRAARAVGGREASTLIRKANTQRCLAMHSTRPVGGGGTSSRKGHELADEKKRLERPGRARWQSRRASPRPAPKARIIRCEKIPPRKSSSTKQKRAQAPPGGGPRADQAVDRIREKIRHHSVGDRQSMKSSPLLYRVLSTTWRNEKGSRRNGGKDPPRNFSRGGRARRPRPDRLSALGAGVDPAARERRELEYLGRPTPPPEQLQGRPATIPSPRP